jgi:hypothetical protein
MWVLYGVYLFLSTPKPLEALGWSLAYAYWMLVRVSVFALLLGALVGAALGRIQQATTGRKPSQGDRDDDTHAQ